jgi:hypothetical protein
MTALTHEQRELLKDSCRQPVRLIDPETNQEYVLLQSEVYDRLQSVIGDPAPRDLYPALQRALKDEGWDDPHMDEYNHRATGATMKAVKGVYEKGKIKLAEKPDEPGPLEVLVVFPELADDPWHEILSDPTPRPVLDQWVREVKEEVAQGQATPLDLQQL